MIILKSSEQIELMDRANRIVHSVLNYAGEILKAGMTTNEVDEKLRSKLAECDGATSAFKGYKGYRCVSCISINEEVVHGVPGDRIINNGDIVSIDFGATYKGFVGDAAMTFVIGNIDNKTQKLVDETKRALYAGIDQMCVGNKLHDIGSAIDAVAKENKFGNLRGFCGHGIGTSMHEAPHVFNYVEPKEPNVRLREGMVFALEPMFTLGSSKGVIQEDGWTVKTEDNSLAAHWELSVAITKDGPRILGL